MAAWLGSCLPSVSPADVSSAGRLAWCPPRPMCAPGVCALTHRPSTRAGLGGGRAWGSAAGLLLVKLVPADPVISSGDTIPGHVLLLLFFTIAGVLKGHSGGVVRVTTGVPAGHCRKLSRDVPGPLQRHREFIWAAKGSLGSSVT